MLMQSLYQHAERIGLIADQSLQNRPIHCLIPLTAIGKLRGKGVVVLYTQVGTKDGTKDQPGQNLLLPRLPGVCNGGKGHFLADNYRKVFKLCADSGDTVLDDTDDRKEGYIVRAYHDFWRRFSESYARIKDKRLQAVLNFRRHYLPETNGAPAKFEWYEWRFPESHRDAGRHRAPKKGQKPQWCVRTNLGDWIAADKVDCVGFEVDGVPLVAPDLGRQTDALWVDWDAAYRREAFPGTAAGDADGVKRGTCGVTGLVNQPLVRSHATKILGVPGLDRGGYLVSFDEGSTAFSSYGFKMGENAPISEQAANACAIALNRLLRSRDTCLRVGDTAFCFWADQATSFAPAQLIGRAKPKMVAQLLESPDTGFERDLPANAAFMSAAVSGNLGRVVVREWVQTSLAKVAANLRQWFEDLDVAATTKPALDAPEPKVGPYALIQLARVLLRPQKPKGDKPKGGKVKDGKGKSQDSEFKRVNAIISRLYRAALDGSAPPLSLLQPLIAEFKSALVNNHPEHNKCFPFRQSRFALLKLILIRNAKKGDFVPTKCIADTDDAAYNSGRLLQLLGHLQYKAHKTDDGELKGPGVVERHFGGVSVAPATGFTPLWRLHFHHLRKLKRQGEAGRRTARGIERQIAEITVKFPFDADRSQPGFPKMLSDEGQGRFLLGYYHQFAYGIERWRASQEDKEVQQDKEDLEDQENRDGSNDQDDLDYDGDDQASADAE